MRTDTEMTRYQKILAVYRNTAKATIASAELGSEAYTEAIKVFLRCDGAIEAMNWVMELGAGDFSVSPTIAQRLRGSERSRNNGSIQK
jgi:hypothetical protein